MLFIATALLAGPRGQGDAGPQGTLALRRLLSLTGRDVREGALPVEPRGTFVLMADLRDTRQAEPILDWVRRGGRLVLADPDSVLLEPLGIDGGAEPPSGRIRAGCAIPESRGVVAMQALGDSGLRTTRPENVPCFARNGGALVVAETIDDGRVVALGDRSPLTNELLSAAGNAVFALQAMPADGPVVFGAPLPPGALASGRGVWPSLPIAARVCIVELGLAIVAFAAMRARRLGRPVPEEPIVPIPSGELVRATGRLLRTARATAYAGNELRRAMIGRLSRRTGAPRASGEELAALLARAGVGSEQELAGVLAGPEPATDDDLIRLGRDIERVRRRVEGTDAAGTADEEGRP